MSQEYIDNKERVMLDLETMGNGSTSAIIAIGAVKFSADRGIHNEFCRYVDLQSCIDLGLTLDASTIMWWMQQSDAAREQFKQPTVSLSSALIGLRDWLTPDSEVWGNGAAFDNAILSNAYRKAGIEQPWPFWNDRCYRTIKSLYPHIKLERKGVYHNPVDDATSQALHLLEIEKVIK